MIETTSCKKLGVPAYTLNNVEVNPAYSGFRESEEFKQFVDGYTGESFGYSGSETLYLVDKHIFIKKKYVGLVIK